MPGVWGIAAQHNAFSPPAPPAAAREAEPPGHCAGRDAAGEAAAPDPRRTEMRSKAPGDSYRGGWCGASAEGPGPGTNAGLEGPSMLVGVPVGLGAMPGAGQGPSLFLPQLIEASRRGATEP
jgi:hypothetical protein